MFGRLLVVLSVAAALMTAPAVTRTRMFCRMTGVEVPPNLCNDESASASQEFTSERCCEHRVQTALDPAKFELQSHQEVAPTAVVVELQCFGWPDLAASPVREAFPSSRPPLSATRILLI
jgi:hypothetical protein